MPRFRAWNQPRPSVVSTSCPRRFSAGTRHSSKITSPHEPWNQRSGASCSRTLRPGVSRGTSSVLTPPAPVRACTAISLASGALATQSFKPLMTQALPARRSEEHTSELQSHHDLVCRLLLEKKKKSRQQDHTSHTLK